MIFLSLIFLLLPFSCYAMEGDRSVERFISTYGDSCQQSIREISQGITAQRELIEKYEAVLFRNDRPSLDQVDTVLARMCDKLRPRTRLINSDVFLRNQLLAVKKFVKEYQNCGCGNHQKMKVQVSLLVKKLEVACQRQQSILEALLYKNKAVLQFIKEKEDISRVLNEIFPDSETDELLIDKVRMLGRLYYGEKETIERLKVQIESLEQQLGKKRPVLLKQRKKGKRKR